MRLSSLEPVLKPESLRFRCPMCGEHWIVIPLSGEHAWKVLGGSTVEDLTVDPSIRAETRPVCLWHGHIQNGEVSILADSYLKK